MKEKQNHLGLYIIMGLALVFSVLCPKMITFAGEINSNEAGVIAAASGTFSYEGKTYQAGTAYINSLTSYLAADDVDLTAEQASEAISMMYANIGEGVAQGYLYEVGGQPSSEDTQTEDAKEEKKKKDTESEATENKKESEQSQADTSGELDVWNAMSNETEAKVNLQKRPDQTEADASVKLEESDIVVTTKDNKTISISKTEQLVPNGILIVADITAGILLAVTAACGIVLFVTKCMSFKKPKSRRVRPGHSRRRRIRRYTRNVLTVTTAISIIGVIVLLGGYVSLFNQNAIMQNMQSSGYFQYAYSEYIADIAGGEAAKSEGDKVTVDTGEIVSYEEYLFTIKQNSLRILNGETDIKIPDSNVTPYIYNLKQSYMKLFTIAGVFIILSMVFGIILMLFMDQRRERGIKHIAAAELAASGIMIIATTLMIANKPYLHLYIEPDYLYLFLMECINWSMKIMISIVAFGVVFGMILVGVYKAVANSYSEN